jgi:hypothetical protein
MGQKVSSSARVRTNYGGPIAHHEVHDPSFTTSARIGESNNTSPPAVSSLSLHQHGAMGSANSSHANSNGHHANQHHQHGSYPSSPYTVPPVQPVHQQSRSRARSLGSVNNDGASSSGLNIPGLMDLRLEDSDESSPEETGVSTPVVTRSRGRTFPYYAQSLPAHLFATPLLQPIQGIKCPVCAQSVPPDDVECHLVICLTKPRIVYNGKSVHNIRYVFISSGQYIL